MMTDRASITGTVRINAYRVIEDAVERGAAYGVRRARKHDDQPPDWHVASTVADAVMAELSEVLIWDEPGEQR